MKKFSNKLAVVTGGNSGIGFSAAKELKDMELNKLVKRTVYPETPVLIEYEPTEYCRTFGNIIQEMINWGREHRRVIVEDR